MPRTLAIWIAFTGGGAMFALAMVLAAVVLGARGATRRHVIRHAAAQWTNRHHRDPRLRPGLRAGHGPRLGSGPVHGHVRQRRRNAPRRHLRRWDEDRGRRAQPATGEVTIPAGGIGFICSVPGHADAGMRGEVMVYR